MSANGDCNPSPARLCHLVLSPDFKGYGFNLHTVKEKPGQFIGQVDEGSPAERALLKQGDRIIEVNGVNIANENHKQVVARVKAIDNETHLLVVDKEGDAWYKKHNIVVNSTMSDVVKASSVARRASTVSSKSEERRSVSSMDSGSSVGRSEEVQANQVQEQEENQYDNINFAGEEQHISSSVQTEQLSTANDELTTTTLSQQHAKEVAHVEEENTSDTESLDAASSASSHSASVAAKSGFSYSPSPPSSVSSPSPPPITAPQDVSGLNLNMSAAEMKAYLMSKKKRDIRQDTIDMKRKHQIIQKL